MEVSRIGIFSQVLFQETISLVHSITMLKESKSLSFFLNPELYDFIAKTNPDKVSKFKRQSLEEMNVDCLITIGGDGTILRAARTRPEIPILSVNKGRKGFMAEIDPKNFSSSFKDYLKGDFSIEEHRRVEAIIDNEIVGSAINEVVITSVDLLKPIDFKLLIDDVIIARTLADGIIAATALGSTGHSLSSGGAVVDPSLPSLEISWINPINLAIRPIVLSPSRALKVRCSTRVNPIKIVIDGQVTSEYNTPLEIIFRLSDQTVKFYRVNSFITRWRQHFHPEIRE
ncbi:MAG: NAD(+)/NADH kinase [Candidatus Hodarchaeales archaeon]